MFWRTDNLLAWDILLTSYFSQNGGGGVEDLGRLDNLRKSSNKKSFCLQLKPYVRNKFPENKCQRVGTHAKS